MWSGYSTFSTLFVLLLDRVVSQHDSSPDDECSMTCREQLYQAYLLFRTAAVREIWMCICTSHSIELLDQFSEREVARNVVNLEVQIFPHRLDLALASIRCVLLNDVVLEDMQSTDSVRKDEVHAILELG